MKHFHLDCLQTWHEPCDCQAALNSHISNQQKSRAETNCQKRHYHFRICHEASRSVSAIEKKVCEPACLSVCVCARARLCVSDLLHLEDSSTLGLSHNRETKARWRITNDFMAKQPLKFFQYVALKTTEQIEIRRWVGFEMRFFFSPPPPLPLSPQLKS